MDVNIEAMIRKSLIAAAGRGAEIRQAQQKAVEAQDAREAAFRQKFKAVEEYLAGIAEAQPTDHDGREFHWVNQGNRLLAVFSDYDDSSDRGSYFFINEYDDPATALKRVQEFIDSHLVIGLKRGM